MIGHVIREFITGLLAPGISVKPEKGRPEEDQAQEDRRVGRWLLAVILGVLAWVVTGYVLQWVGW